MWAPCPEASRYARSGAAVCGLIASVAPAAFARHAQRIEAAVLVQIADLERSDLGAAQPDLQRDGEDRAIAQSRDRVPRNPATVSSAGTSRILRACAFEKAG